jgi:NADPH-dependent 2,4-dienoyl-CoA reductase/sulfur reductase-like enzyme
MPDSHFTYIIAGGGLAGASAAEGIRSVDREGSILLLGGENHLPYDRPPLSKKLWLGKKKVEDIFLHDEAYYSSNRIELMRGVPVVRIDPGAKRAVTADGKAFGFDKMLVATGGTPRTLGIPGGDLEEICYFRRLDDYLKTRERAAEKKSAVIIGGGFIGSEMAAALRLNGLEVSMVFPEQLLVERIFPGYLASALQEHFRSRGIAVYAGDVPVSFEKKGGRIVTSTRNGRSIISDIVIAGVGIAPSLELANSAGLAADDGIIADEYLRTSNPDIYTAGDNTNFYCRALERRMRVEHWDSALQQGKQAGRNMAGAKEIFDYIPYFFSDLFDFGYEAVGEIDSRLETFADWQKENDTGVIYYMKDGRLRGLMMCNVWDKVEAARALIRKNERVSPAALKGAIR